jgi:hypothetical protein
MSRDTKCSDVLGVAIRRSRLMFHQFNADSSTAAGEQGQNVCSNPRDRHSYIPSPRPSSRNTRTQRNTTLLSLAVILVVLASLFGTASALESQGDRRRSAFVPVDELTPVWKGPSLLVVDTRPPPVPPMLMHLDRRDSHATTSTQASKTIGINTDPSATQSSFAIPQPFDTALSNNYTTPCAAWFRRLLTNSIFNACHPFSLMLQVRWVARLSVILH